ICSARRTGTGDRPHWDEIVRWVIVKPYETGINAALVVIRGAVSNGGGRVPGQAPTSAMESSYRQTKPSGITSCAPFNGALIQPMRPKHSFSRILALLSSQ